MNFGVAPDSGAAPYTASIEFRKKELIDGVNYRLWARPPAAANSCVAPEVGVNPVSAMINDLLANDEFIILSDVPTGMCRPLAVALQDLSTGVYYDYKVVYVDNV